MHELIEGLSGTEVVADDFTVAGFGDTLEEAIRNNNKNLVAFLQHCSQRGVKLAVQKPQLCLEETLSRRYYLMNTLHMNSDVHSRSTRYSNFNFICPDFKRKTEGGRTFSVSTCQLWNSLSLNIRKQPTVKSFRNFLTEKSVSCKPTTFSTF